jgi:hypothetical protein
MAENNFGAYHLANNPKVYEPARSNTFRFVVTDIDNIKRVGYSAEDNSAAAKIANAQEMLEFSVAKTSIPHFTQTAIVIRRGNSVMKAAGLPEFSEGSLTINDFIGADGKSVLMAWQNLSYNVDTQMIGYMSDYKKNCWLIEYDPNYKIVRQWILYGCWVKGITEQEFDMEGGDKRQITAEIEYDYAKMQMPDEDE